MKPLITTYRELQIAVNKIPNERLDDNITIFDVLDDEFYPKTIEIHAAQGIDVLDDGHVYIELHEPQ